MCWSCQARRCVYTQSVWSSVLVNIQDVDGWMDCCIRAASYQVARLLGRLQEIAIADDCNRLLQSL